MKKMFEILLSILILFSLIYSLLYVFYFDGFCENLWWKDEKNLVFAINKLAKCKDSLVCYPENIEANEINSVNSWNCVKKDSPVFGADLYIDIFNHFKNSITK